MVVSTYSKSWILWLLCFYVSSFEIVENVGKLGKSVRMGIP